MGDASKFVALVCNIFVTRIIGPAAAGSAGPIPPPLIDACLEGDNE